MDKKESGGSGRKQQESMGSGATKIKTDFPPDHGSDMKTNHSMRVGKMGGSVENLSHSLSGASAKQRGPS